MRLIVTRPQHDVTTRYISSWAEEIIACAQQKNVDIIDLLKDKANRNELESRIKKLMPKLIFLNGHGSDDSVAGHNNETLVKARENHDLLKGKITYSLSCDSGRVLGPMVAANEDTVYIGYQDEFIFVFDKNYISKPMLDPRAKPFMESSNQLMISLLKGHEASESSNRSKNVFRKKYTELLASTTDVDSLQAAQFLWWNMKNQVCLGNELAGAS